MSKEDYQDTKKLIKGVIFFSTFASLSFLISGAVFLPYKQNISQLLGYFSFLFILIGAIGGLAYARIVSDRSADLVFNANESTKMPRLRTFVLLNLLVATVFVLVILQKILFSGRNSCCKKIVKIKFSDQCHFLVNIQRHWEQTFPVDKQTLYNKTLAISGITRI